MANRYAVATGNWSSLATWDGGVSLPTTGDIVRPNGFTVTIDQDITVSELRSDASAPAAAQGTFILNGGLTVTANITGTSTTTVLLTYAANSPSISSITGTISSSGSSAIYQVLVH